MNISQPDQRVCDLLRAESLARSDGSTKVLCCLVQSACQEPDERACTRGPRLEHGESDSIAQLCAERTRVERFVVSAKKCEQPHTLVLRAALSEDIPELGVTSGALLSQRQRRGKIAIGARKVGGGHARLSDAPAGLSSSWAVAIASSRNDRASSGRPRQIS